MAKLLATGFGGANMLHANTISTYDKSYNLFCNRRICTSFEKVCIHLQLKMLASNGHMIHKLIETYQSDMASACILFTMPNVSLMNTPNL